MTHTPRTGFILDGDQDLVFGCVQLGNQFGEITKVSESRNGSVTEIENGRGGIHALVMSGFGFTLEVEAIFDANDTLPVEGMSVAFPYSQVRGRVLPDPKIEWAPKGARKVTFTARFCDDFATETTPGSGFYENLATAIAPNGALTPLP